MGELILNIIGEFLLWFNDDSYKSKKKKRRTYAKKNSSSNKELIPPIIKVLLVLIILIFISYFLIKHFYLNDLGENKTKKKIVEIERILKNEKNKVGKYPEKLELIIRNNPLRKNLIYDFWKNKFHYTQMENGNSYQLFSLGKDGIINTPDDIKNK